MFLRDGKHNTYFKMFINSLVQSEFYEFSRIFQLYYQAFIILFILWIQLQFNRGIIKNRFLGFMTDVDELYSRPQLEIFSHEHVSNELQQYINLRIIQEKLFNNCKAFY